MEETEGTEEREAPRVLWEMPDGFGLQADGTYKLKLEHPIDWDPEEGPVEFLHFRLPCGKDFRAVPPQPKTLDAWMQFGSKLCRVPGALVDRLQGRDAARFVEVSTHFFGGSPEDAGRAPSAT